MDDSRVIIPLCIHSSHPAILPCFLDALPASLVCTTSFQSNNVHAPSTRRINAVTPFPSDPQTTIPWIRLDGTCLQPPLQALYPAI